MAKKKNVPKIAKTFGKFSKVKKTTNRKNNHFEIEASWKMLFS